MSDGSPNAGAPATEAPATTAPAQSPDDVLVAAVKAMESRPKAPDAPAAEPAAAAAEPEKPAEPAPEAKPDEPKPEPSAAEARKVLAQAQKTLAEAQKATDALLRDLAADFRRSPRTALAKLAKLAKLEGSALDLEGLIDADIADTTARETGKPEAEAPAGDDRLTALEQKIAAAEQREHDAKIAARVAEIQGDVAKDPRFPTIQARGKAGLVTKFMARFYEKNGAPIAWDKAAQIVEDDLRSLAGGAPPKPAPAAAAPAAKPAESPRQPTLSGEGRDYVPPNESEIPKDPEAAIRFLVEHAYKQAGRSLS